MENLYQIKEAYESIPLYSDEELSAMDSETLGEYLELLEAREHFKKTHKLLYFTPDEWVSRLNRKMVDNGMCSIIASNRSGKSYSTTWLLAAHLTGIYPEGYEDFRYDCAIDSWLLSPTAENYVQAGGLQEYLLGKAGEFGCGWIPDECIIKTETGMGTKGFIKKVYVRHASGGVSTVEYKSYSQGQHVLMGGNVDFILIDEEPRDTKIVGQCATRVSQATSGKGRVLLCFTPENGMSDVVSSCFEGQWKDGCERITVYDVSFITPEKIEEMKRNIPEREHNMRLLGIPSIGRGAVFPQQEHEIKFYESDVVIQDHWKVAAAIDFGYLPDPCAILFGAYDPDAHYYYIFKEYYETEKTPAQIAGWIKSHAPTIPVIYPADGVRKQQAAQGQTMVDLFKAEGVNMYKRVDYGKAGQRDTGHTQIRTLFREGRLWVSDSCHNWFKEFRVYQYDEKGNTNHCQDHAMDALRYLMQQIDSVGVPYRDAKSTVYNRWSSNSRKMSKFTNQY